ncbi:MAG TPA: outer membrane lipoprotein chaperone LolA [Thermodesulfobacteriota bacterium]|nr:outer membrane lipoprotein chaperone LolA [Thermodesulfobacteriota bacterium]
MKKFIFVILGLLFTSTAGYSVQNESIDVVVDKIQKKYEEIEDFHADFTQEATVKALNTVQKSDGEVWFKKPGKMRWNYYEPYKDQIVSDGRTLWFYNEEEKQVIESPLNQVSDTESTSTLLSGLGKIKDLYKTSFTESGEFEADGSYLIDLRPKEEGEDYNKVTLAINKNTMMVNTLYLYDPFGNLTKVLLKNVEVDKGVSDSLFDFKAPSGVEIIKPPASAAGQ